jgi:secreted Zn-dependent insulinase-like peptidase
MRMFARVWESVLGEYLAEFRYMAECARLDSAVQILYDGIMINFNGFNDSMPNYIKETFKRMSEMRNADLSKEFGQEKEALL